MQTDEHEENARNFLNGKTAFFHSERELDEFVEKLNLSRTGNVLITTDKKFALVTRWDREKYGYEYTAGM